MNQRKKILKSKNNKFEILHRKFAKKNPPFLQHLLSLKPSNW